MSYRGDKSQKIQERCQAELSQLLRDEDNKYCVDCDAKGPRWASWNIGIFLCIRCAGIHRNLGVHISKVKSVNLDSWTPEQVVCLQQMGNSRARAVYEANIPDSFRRPQTDSSLEAFIRSKYEAKKYIAKEWVPPPMPKVNWDLELEDKKKEKKRSKMTTAKVELPAPIALQKLPPSKSGSSPSVDKKPATKIVENSSSSNSKPSASEDLLGLVTSQPAASSDPFELMIGPSTTTPPSSSPSTVSQETTTNSNEEEKSFFSQTAPSEDKKQALTNDSIMALFMNSGSAAAPPQQMSQQPLMFSNLQQTSLIASPNLMSSPLQTNLLGSNQQQANFLPPQQQINPLVSSQQQTNVLSSQQQISSMASSQQQAGTLPSQANLMGSQQQPNILAPQQQTNSLPSKPQTNLLTSNQFSNLVNVSQQQPGMMGNMQQSNLFASTQQGNLMPSTQQANLMQSTQQANLMSSTQQANLMPSTQQTSLMPSMQQANLMSTQQTNILSPSFSGNMTSSSSSPASLMASSQQSNLLGSSQSNSIFSGSSQSSSVFSGVSPQTNLLTSPQQPSMMTSTPQQMMAFQNSVISSNSPMFPQGFSQSPQQQQFASPSGNLQATQMSTPPMQNGVGMAFNAGCPAAVPLTNNNPFLMSDGSGSPTWGQLQSHLASLSLGQLGQPASMSTSQQQRPMGNSGVQYNQSAQMGGQTLATNLWQ